jgi:hypothetical protein
MRSLSHKAGPRRSCLDFSNREAPGRDDEPAGDPAYRGTHRFSGLTLVTSGPDVGRERTQNLNDDERHPRPHQRDQSQSQSACYAYRRYGPDRRGGCQSRHQASRHDHSIRSQKTSMNVRRRVGFASGSRSQPTNRPARRTKPTVTDCPHTRHATTWRADSVLDRLPALNKAARDLQTYPSGRSKIGRAWFYRGKETVKPFQTQEASPLRPETQER